jgi:hypothetical protein
MSRFNRVVMLILVAVLASRADAGVSKLWGERGENWNQTSPLPDFRYAGYRSGRDPVPQHPAVTDVKQHGATGDGKTDDTAAFLAAVTEASQKRRTGVAISIPACGSPG